MNFKAFRSSMKHRIRGNPSWTSVVPIKWCGRRERISKPIQETVQPLELNTMKTIARYSALVGDLDTISCFLLYGVKNDQSRQTNHHMPRLKEVHLSSMISRPFCMCIKASPIPTFILQVTPPGAPLYHLHFPRSCPLLVALTPLQGVHLLHRTFALGSLS